jgi:TonB family protein
MFELKRRLQLGGTLAGTDPVRKQQIRMALAVALLLAALAIVIVKDRSVWFDSADGDLVPDSAFTPTPAANSAPGVTVPSPHVGAPARSKIRRAEAVAEQPAEQPGIVARNRKALPPLDIEVVAGDSHRMVRSTNKSLRVEMAPEDDLAGKSAAAPLTAASQKVTMSADATQAVEHSVDPSYPTLARQMRVQGAVILQALIGADGLIQDLKVVSGPTILASAAREAVRQWHFKPYLENGKAVETQAQITVNFTISTL